jgi:hypothetical protein
MVPVKTCEWQGGSEPKYTYQLQLLSSFVLWFGDEHCVFQDMSVPRWSSEQPRETGNFRSCRSSVPWLFSFWSELTCTGDDKYSSLPTFSTNPQNFLNSEKFWDLQPFPSVGRDSFSTEGRILFYNRTIYIYIYIYIHIYIYTYIYIYIYIYIYTWRYIPRHSCQKKKFLRISSLTKSWPDTTSAYVSILSADISIRQHTSAYVSMRKLCISCLAKSWLPTTSVKKIKRHKCVDNSWQHW